MVAMEGGQAELEELARTAYETPASSGAASVEFFGASLLQGLNGTYTKPAHDWIVAASNGQGETAGLVLNGRPRYEKPGEVLHQPTWHLFYGWAERWGRFGQAGWFLSDELPPEQEPVVNYWMFNPSSAAATPDLCRATWETRGGRRDKRLFCEDAMAQSGSSGHGLGASMAAEGFLEEELWPTQGAAAVDGQSCAPAAARAAKAARPPRAASAPSAGTIEPREWQAQLGEDEWEEPVDEEIAGELPPAEEPEREVPEVEAPSEARPARAAGTSSAGKSRGRSRRAGAAEETILQHAPGFVVVSRRKPLPGSTPSSKPEEAAEERRRRRACQRQAAEDEERRRLAAEAPSTGSRAHQPEAPGDSLGQCPMGPESLGAASALVDGWSRLASLHEKPCLFKRIQPDDVVAETSAGNYWFLSACAAVANYPAWIQAMFGRTTRLSPEGRYSVRLYHPGKQEFVRVRIDDRVPTRRDCPVFAGITGDGELWVALVEKAFARLCGSYAKTEWGTVAYGLLYLCGGRAAESWSRLGPKKWRRASTVWRGGASAGLERESSEGLVVDGQQHDAGQLWATLRGHLARCHPVVCGVDPRREEACGLHRDRCYSLLAAREVPVTPGKALRMLLLRNPFGVSEWQGRWGDTSDAWEQHPAVAELLEARQASDGTFWMPYHEFLRHFDAVDVVRKPMPVQGCHRALCAGAREGLGLHGA